MLEDIAQEPDAGKISLLEGVPFERELAQFKSTFGAVKFDNLFRSSKIYAYQQYHPQPYGNYTSIPSLPSPQTTNAVPNGINGQQAPTNFVSGHTQGLARTPSSSTSESNPAQPTSWATKAMSAPAFQLPAPPPSSQPQPPTIPRNKYGQRIDPLLKMDPTEFKRVQKIKMCNVHFIRRDCPFGDDCTHVHSYKPSKSELDILKQVARSTPCRFGTDCDEMKCIYGHRYAIEPRLYWGLWEKKTADTSTSRCPHQAEGQKGCRYGSNCKFPDHMHGIDTRVVRTTKV